MVRRGRWSAATGSVLGLVALTVVAAMATGITAAMTRSDQRDADRDAARVAADRFATALTAITSAVAGVDGLAVDGRVDADEFDAFASDVSAAGAFPALAFVELVPDSDRAEWESTVGATMQDTNGAGGFLPAAARPMHAVVRLAAPVNDTTRRVIGFDMMSDAVRAAGIQEATSSDGTKLVGPISTVTEGRIGLFMAASVRDRNGGLVGFIGAGLSLQDAADQLQELNDVRRVRVEMDGKPLLDAGGGPASETFVLAGRTFTVEAGAERTQSWIITGLLALTTVMLGAAAAFALRRDRAARAREGRAARRAALLADFAEQLVTANSTSATARLAADRAGAIVGATHTNVGIRAEADPSKLSVTHDAGMDAELADRFALQAVNDDLPLAEAARTGSIVWVGNRTDYRARYPHVIDDVSAAGIHAVCCVPLDLGNDEQAGVIGFAFDHPLDAADRGEIESAASVVSQMTGRALDRARVREVVQHRVDLLADLARELTTVHSSEQVSTAVSQMLPPLLDVTSAELVGGTREDGPGNRVYEPRDAADVRLVLRLSEGRRWATIDETLATTVTDLVGGALSRTRLQDQERAVLQRLQATLLMPPPHIAGFNVAVGYRSALATVGMGGDWYSIIDGPDAVHAVIGDVAGHGPGAVALMSEVKTVMRHLLTTGAPIDEVVRHADSTLQRRNAYASMVVVRIDKTAPRLDYVNAGHPPPLIYTSHGVVALDEIHRPWLGVEPSGNPAPTSCDFVEGDLLLLYTDGLVEQRDEQLDHSIRTRLHGIDHRPPVTDLVDGLLAARQEHRDAATVDDDVAIIAVRRTG